MTEFAISRKQGKEIWWKLQDWVQANLVEFPPTQKLSLRSRKKTNKLGKLLLWLFFFPITSTFKGIHFGELYPIKYLIDRKKIFSNHSTTRLEWFTHANDRSKTDETFPTVVLICYPRKFIFGKSFWESWERNENFARVENFRENFSTRESKKLCNSH